MSSDASARKDPSGLAGQPGGLTAWGRLVAWGPYRALADFTTASPRRQFVILAAFPILWVLTQHLGPMLQMLRVSLTDAYPVAQGVEQSFTLDNYLRFFGDRIFWMPFFRTLAFAGVFTFCTLILTYPVAYFLARHVSRRNQMLMLLLLLVPFWVGEIVRTYAIMILLGNTGAVNLVLKWLGLIDRPIPFMYTSFSMGVGIVYLTALYMLLPLYSALEKLPKSYNEAAADLGAGAWTRFRRVTLPLTLEGISSGCTLVFLISTGFYATPVLLGGPSTTVFAETIAGFFHVAGDEWPTGAAFATIMFLAALLITGVFQRVMRGLRKGDTG
ncbi:spermidine/putrescine transport system permease protein [Cribrihabitans marinus]|uniref:Spermidine/putrescine transport system permease protein n=1 Tax=Cribrihabitans marinus TaxID=1227549 RepID=A0A1H7DSP3_9RHOB|nr:ABC transporter permease [Cribrihabitans marinus]GGH39857.1 spermidine/putrescine ABC transporter permease [Cribrihabitans marinus]SEK04434.1 spermidine/putrescine transport system permease protein [Cribrihabitans marinus]